MEEKEVKNRWKEYFEELVNIENKRDDMEKSGLVYGPVEEFSVVEVLSGGSEEAIGELKEPTRTTAENFKWLGIEGIGWLTTLMNKIMEEEIFPVAWTIGVI